jgi:hypothetical protein
VQPENLKLGGGLTSTMLHPAVLVAMLIAVLLILWNPKKYGVASLLFVAFLVPMGQQFVIGGLHVFVVRIVILVALIRCLFSMFFSHMRAFPGGLTTFDKVFMCWTFFHVISFLFLFSFSSGALVNQVGFIWDVLGGFFLLRFLIRDEDDIEGVIKTFSWIAAISAVCMLNERFRFQNVFGFLGGAPIVPEIRDGAVRAQAAFAHPLLAGTFGATLLPLFFLLLHIGKSKALAVVGILSATTMTICASSSTPLLAYVAGIGAMCFWPFRKYMRVFRWGIVLALVALNIVMKAPVWYLIAHISLFGGSSSDHRAVLVDAFIRHFSDWWLIGTNAAGTWGWDMWDTSNQYVAEGEGGGLAAFVCFIALISICFSRIGKARKAVEGDSAKAWYFWFFGAALFAHVVGFFGISYFEQSRFYWFALLIMIVVATAPVLATNENTESQTAGLPLPAPQPIATHPWLDAPARKTALGHAGSQFKPRRS